MHAPSASGAGFGVVVASRTRISSGNGLRSTRRGDTTVEWWRPAEERGGVGSVMEAGGGGGGRILEESGGCRQGVGSRAQRTPYSGRASPGAASLRAAARNCV